MHLPDNPHGYFLKQAYHKEKDEDRWSDQGIYMNNHLNISRWYKKAWTDQILLGI